MKMLDKQRGVTLLVAMIMLILITMLVITSVNLGGSSLQTVGNMQHRNETVTAAQEALEEVISNKRFFESPESVFLAECDGSYNAKCIDINEDGTPDVTVLLSPAPTCVQARVLQNSQLNLNDPEQAGCPTPPAQEAFGIGGPTDNSECGTSIWDIQATATDAVTQSTVAVSQGISVMVPKNALDTSCPE